MPLIKFKPTTPTRRFGNVSDFSEITVKKPYKPLTYMRKQSAGRNSHGHITSRHRGRGHKRRIRIVDFRRNRYGDAAYSAFLISEESYLNKKGVYAYVLETAVMYIGRCKDTMRKRINHGYGKIHPKNCYLDGQATNCHLNLKITAAKANIELWLCPIDSNNEIEKTERELILRHKPPWNIQRYL